MKTFKIATLIVGIFVAGICYSTHAADKNKAGKTEVEKKAIFESMGINKAMELALIRDYLTSQNLTISAQSEPVKKAMIYNANYDLVYDGNFDTHESAALRIKAEFLMMFGNTIYFMLHEGVSQ